GRAARRAAGCADVSLQDELAGRGLEEDRPALHAQGGDGQQEVGGHQTVVDRQGADGLGTDSQVERAVTVDRDGGRVRDLVGLPRLDRGGGGQGGGYRP